MQLLKLTKNVYRIKPGYQIVVSDGDVSPSMIGDAARMLTMLWKPV